MLKFVKIFFKNNIIFELSKPILHFCARAQLESISYILEDKVNVSPI